MQGGSLPPDLPYTSPLRRVIAAFLDLVVAAAFFRVCYPVVMIVILGTLGVLGLDEWARPLDVALDAAGPWIIMGLIVIGHWIYCAVMESSRLHATLAKWKLRCYVADLNQQRISFWRASVRHWAKLLSVAILFIGVLMAFRNPRRQMLHDRIAGCIVLDG